MKHFGAVLTGDANIVDGGESSILRVGAASGTHDDVIIINNNNATTGTTDAASDGTVHGLVLIPSATGRGDTHVLGADGREVAIADLSTSQSFTAVGSIPVANDSATAAGTFTGTADQYIASAITQIGSGSTSTITVAGNLQVSGTTTTVDSTIVTIADRFLELGTASADFAAAVASGGLLITDQRVGGVNGYGGFRWNGVNSVFEFSADTTNGTDGNWTAFGASGAGVQSVVGGAGIAVDATTDANNPVASVSANTNHFAFRNAADTAADTGDTGVLTLADAGILEPKLNVVADSTNSGTATPASGQVLAYNSAGDGTFTWVTPAGGTVGKSIQAFNKPLGDTSITISQATHAIPAGIDGANLPYTVQVYEFVNDLNAAGGLNQIIPESIVIAANGNITITFGATTAALLGRVIIKG